MKNWIRYIFYRLKGENHHAALALKQFYDQRDSLLVNKRGFGSLSKLMRDYPQLDPSSSDFNYELSDELNKFILEYWGHFKVKPTTRMIRFFLKEFYDL